MVDQKEEIEGKKDMSNKFKKDPISETEAYIEFLKKRLNSENYKQNVSADEYKKEKAKYDKAKLKLKFLKQDKK